VSSAQTLSKLEKGNPMKYRILLSCFAVLLFSSAASAKVHTGIDVNIQPIKSSLTNNEDVYVKVSYKNRSNQAVNILRWYLPDANGNLEEGIFKISRDGEVIDYLGAHYKRPAPTDADYVTLNPNQKLSYKVELSGVYDLSEEGQYSVSLDVSNMALFSPSTANKPNKGNGDSAVQASALKSDAQALVYVSKVSSRKRCNPRKEDCGGGGGGTEDVTFTGACSNSEQNSIFAGLDAAKSMTNSSVSYLNGSVGPRYTTWFGTYSSARFNKVAGNFDAIKDALDNKPKVFDCSCNQSYYAYVYPSQPYKVYLCRAFWSAGTTGTDSKGGTIIHELSHFNVVAGTDDIVYGQTGAKNLAISDPNGATNNADNHEYFGENTPNLN
jgi:peptidyl-Lys metalloendopeptidase